MPERPDGLASLTQARQRARRVMPPPRHPAISASDSSSPARTPDGPAPAADSSRTGSSSAAASGDDARTRPPATEPRTRLSAVPAAAGQVPAGDPVAASAPAERQPVEPAVKLTLYVDADLDRYLEDVRIHGLTSRPKVDVSRSAVVRLALRRLRDDMTSEQVKTLLAEQPTDPTRTGRKRR